MKTKSNIETLKELVMRGRESGLSPAQLQRATAALKRLEAEAKAAPQPLAKAA